MAAKKGHAIWFWVVALALALTVAFLVFSPAFQGYVEQATSWAEGVMRSHKVAGAVVFFVMSALSAMLAFATSAVLVPPALEVFGKAVTFLLLWGGWMAGAVAAYAIGRLARPLLVRWGYGKKLEEYQQFVSKGMKFWAVLLLCIAVPSEIPGYLLGGIHYSFTRFLAAMGIAEGIYALTVIIAAERLLDAKPASLIAIGAAVIGFVVGAGFLLRKFK